MGFLRPVHNRHQKRLCSCIFAIFALYGHLDGIPRPLAIIMPVFSKVVLFDGHSYFATLRSGSDSDSRRQPDPRPRPALFARAGCVAKSCSAWTSSCRRSRGRKWAPCQGDVVQAVQGRCGSISCNNGRSAVRCSLDYNLSMHRLQVQFGRREKSASSD